jgi:energy-coupling factor transporter ATP-binding protein EcfA2
MPQVWEKDQNRMAGLDKNLTILELQAENIKKLTVVRIRPDGKLVQITGKNGAGKTSVLDSIWWALSGTANIQEQPINDAAHEARIRLDMGEIIVTRYFRRTIDKEPPYTTRLTVEAADGARFPSPQTMLDEMIGELSFDPLAFTRLKPKEQFDALKVFVTGIDIEQLDRENLRDFELRTSENRKAAELKAQMAGIDAPDSTIGEPVDEEALVRELEAAGEKNKEIELRRQRRISVERDKQRLEANADRIAEEIIELRARIERLQAQEGEAREQANGLATRLSRAEPLPELIATEVLLARIRQAREANEKLRLSRQKAELLEKAEQHRKRADALTQSMQARREHKEAAIAAAKMPVEGLGFGEGEITLGGRPFNQASDAEQLRASIAIAISMNPKIRVIRVRDGSLLDEDGIRLVAEMAENHGAQVWLERVDSTGKIGFVLEDGHVKGT